MSLHSSEAIDAAKKAIGAVAGAWSAQVELGRILEVEVDADDIEAFVPDGEVDDDLASRLLNHLLEKGNQ